MRKIDNIITGTLLCLAVASMLLCIILRIDILLLVAFLIALSAKAYIILFAKDVD